MKALRRPDRNELPKSNSKIRWVEWWSHRGEVIFYYLIGVVMVGAPPYWFGPTWSYFKFLPHGGFGIGVACLFMMYASVDMLLRALVVKH